MRVSEPAAENYKKVCKNLAILAKSATPGEAQLTFSHATDRNKSLGGFIVAFALAVNLDSPFVVSIKMDIAFSADSNKIRLPITEVLLYAAAADLVRSKKQQDWTPHNAVLLLLFLTEAAIFNEELYAGDLLNIFARSITE